MSDQCQHCTLREDMAGCKATECSIHESWYVSQLQAEIERLWEEAACPYCKGGGEVDENQCPKCHGTGLARVAHDQARRRGEQMRGTLIELRLRLHAAGRRPEECHELSLIDEALKEAR